MRIAKSLALGLTCALAAAGSAQAQSQPKKFVQLLTVHARPEGALEYEAFAKKVMAAADKIGQNQRVLVYQATAGSPGYTYMIVTSFDKWAETDEMLSTPEILMKALGEVEGAKAIRAGRTSIASTETAVYRLLPDLSTKPKAYDPPPAYLQVLRNEIKPEMTRQWERVMARYEASAEQVPEAPTAIRGASVSCGRGRPLPAAPHLV